MVTADKLIEGVSHDRLEHGQGIAHSPGRSRQVDDQRATRGMRGNTSESPGQGSRRYAGRHPFRSNGLRDARHKGAEARRGLLWRHVRGGQARAAGRQDQPCSLDEGSIDRRADRIIGPTPTPAGWKP